MRSPDRILGCLLGGALGDALAAPDENCSPGTVFEIQPALRITDDTQLTLATCEAIVESGRVDPAEIADRFAAWHRGRRVTGVGASTLKALTELAEGGHWAMVGASGERSAGNGPATRIAPLAVRLNPDVPVDRRVLRDVCRITHHNEESYVGALVLAYSVRVALAGERLDDPLISLLADCLPDSRVRDRVLEITALSPTVSELAGRFGSGGYVVESVPFAILAAIRATDFLSMIEHIVFCGGDVDSIASMAGQLFGALHGTESLPLDLLTRIADGAQVRRITGDFAVGGA